MTEAASVEALCRDIYREVNAFPDIITARQQGLGFEVLMGRPRLNPPIAFVGYQPGNWELDVHQARQAGYESYWVDDRCHYAEKPWPLAKELRSIFTQELLEQCVGTNAIFVRAGSIKEYRARLDWKTRARLQQFCLQKVQQMLEAMAPRTIVVIGMETMKILNRCAVSVRGEKRVVLRKGPVWGFPAIASMHLTGARISTADRLRIRETLVAHIQATI